jgi:membrane-bound metal-dependent hydrolase YbcI (DUF457 family)
MKGIAHFATGIAVGTFFKEAVLKALNEQSFVLVLGGIFGLLPDTLDFKFGKYFEKVDYVIDPDPNKPKPQEIAKILAKAANEAYNTGKPKKVQLHTMKISAFRWRRYGIFFNPKEKNVVVEIGPEVSTSQVPYYGTEPKRNKVGKAKIKAKLSQEVLKPSIIDIMTGPSFKFERKGDLLEIKFLPWHRQWSHSFTVGAILALVVGLIFGKLAGIISFLGWAFHIIEDLFGFMGGNLLFPITKDRTKGAHLIKASSSLGNFFVVYASVLIILFNLDRFSNSPIIKTPWYLYFLFYFIIPAILIFLIAPLFKIEDITERDKMAEKFLEEMDEVSEEFL